MNWIQRKLFAFGVVGMVLILLLFSADVSANASVENDLKKQQIEQMYEDYQRKDFPDVLTVMVDRLLAWQQSESVVLVDVRKPKEQAVSMIPSAMSLDEFQENLAIYEDYKIVYYCTIGYRSGIEAQKAQKKNLDVYNLHGGVLAWSHAGQPFLDGERETRDVHVYGKKWNLTPQSYNPVW